MKHALAMLLASALTVTTGVADGSPTLAGSEWGLGADASNDVVVKFEAGGKVWGRLGCNRFTGSYDQKGVALRFGPLATTRMACAPEKMKTEADMAAFLSATRTADITHLKLILRDGAGKALVTLQRRDFD